MSVTKNRESVGKKWILKEDTSPETAVIVDEIATKLSVSKTMARLLVNRGYRDADSAGKFIRMESELLCDPFLFADMEKALSRIHLAIENGEKIVIYGDYDVDGVTSVSVLYLYLTSKGAQVSYYIPNRIGDGYGVSIGAIDRLAAEGARLFLTVDTGITAVEEVAYAAKEKGIDFIVTDHHECHGDLPPAVAVVNPHRPDCPYPFKDLAGVGVVFKLICAYEERYTGDSRRECVARLCQEYADLVAIGTIADVMPIKGENKLIVSYGLGRIEKNRRLGLSALMEAANPKNDTPSKRAKTEPKITSGYISYTIAPRLNAAGRIRSASLAAELFLTKEETRAREIAAELCEANKERQVEENRITAEAFAKIEEEHNFEKDPVIVLADDTWHHGVIGIVSSRITEKYGLPSILVSFEGSEGKGEGDMGKGSGRSIKGMNLAEALVYCENELEKHGGHELAAGLSVTRGNLPLFRERINEYARAHLTEEDMIPVIEADCMLGMSEIGMDLASELRRLLEPYGVGNPLPVFAMFSVLVEEVVPVSGGKHTRLLVRDGDTHMTAMCFSMETDSLDIYHGERVDMLFCVDINEWNGRRSVQLLVKDIRPAERERVVAENEKRRFEEIFGGGPIEKDEDVVPDREDFAAVYTVVRRLVRSGEDTVSIRRVRSLLHTEGHEVGYVKLKFIFRIFQELNLLGIEEITEDVFRFRLQFTTVKTDLEKSNLLRQLRTRERVK
ncbi:MAG: single-stranded-DNA-specific exonuclease RecJ [Clostridia bacterium]|nr:single-stranded-DNA-specific exonuclease RecJ [Clostridia bacterium]